MIDLRQTRRDLAARIRSERRGWNWLITLLVLATAVGIVALVGWVLWLLLSASAEVGP